MKVKPFKQEVIALALQFLEKELGQAKIAQQLRQKYLEHTPEWVLKNNLLIKKGLIKVIKSFVQMDKKIKEYYVGRKAGSEAEEESQMQEQQPKKSKEKAKNARKASAASINNQNNEKPAKKKIDHKIQSNTNEHHEHTSTWVKNKFAPPQKLENIGKQDKVQNQKPLALKTKKASMTPKQASSEESEDRPMHSEESESEEKPKKKIKNQKKEKKEKERKKAVKNSQSQEQPQEEQVKKPVTKTKKIVKQEKKQAKQEAEDSQEQQEKPHRMHTRSEDHKPEQTKKTYENNNSNNHKNHKSSYSSFSRIKVNEVGPIKQQLQDNSFQAKFKYGKGGDEWGKYGHERLKDTRGESFKKTKDKLKNKAFQGGNIDFNVINSIPID